MATKQWKDLSGKEKAVGITTLLLIVIIVIVGISALVGGDGSKDANNQEVVNQNLPEPDQIKQIVNNVLPGKVNDKDYVRKIDIVDQPAGSYGAFVEYNAKDFNKTLIDVEMANVYRALYTSGKNVSSASVSAYSSLVDQFGNESDRLVYKTLLDKSEADKVNFDADEATLQVSILPGLWQTTMLHSQLRE